MIIKTINILASSLIYQPILPLVKISISILDYFTLLREVVLKLRENINVKNVPV